MQTITISGREFKPVTDSTLEHDMWTLEHVAKCGLQNVLLLEGETPDEFANRILLQVSSGGAIFDLLGGLYMPAETSAMEWSPELARQTGRIFARAAGDDKQVVKGEIAGAMISFLAQGLLSSKLSPKSSAQPAASL